METGPTDLSPIKDPDRLLQDVDINRLRAVVFRDVVSLVYEFVCAGCAFASHKEKQMLVRMKTALVIVADKPTCNTVFFSKVLHMHVNGCILKQHILKLALVLHVVFFFF